jgi:tRNA(Ile)-lysidine synthase
MRRREGSLVRPLLAFTREETAAYCVERGLTWREDETNDLDVFARSRIRHDLVPALRRVHPGAERNVLALIETLRDEAAALDAVVDEALGDASRIELGRLRQLAPALRRLVIQRLADDAAGGLAPGAARRADELLALSEQGTASLDIGNGVRAVVEYGLLRFEPAADAPEPPRTVSLPVPGRVRFGDFEVRCEIGPPTREAGVLDRAELGPELVVRSWRAGDRMSPIGLSGTKSLQDLFTARRVPRGRRAAIAVVESGGEIAWVAGVATSERFKVTDSTREAVHLTVESRGGGAAPAT